MSNAVRCEWLLRFDFSILSGKLYLRQWKIQHKTSSKKQSVKSGFSAWKNDDGLTLICHLFWMVIDRQLKKYFPLKTVSVARMCIYFCLSLSLRQRETPTNEIYFAILCLFFTWAEFVVFFFFCLILLFIWQTETIAFYSRWRAHD